MIYHYRTVKCPKCGEVADRTRTVDSQELRGTPFRVCCHCGTVYFDPDYKEEAISVFKDKGGDTSITSYLWLIISNVSAVYLLVEAAKLSFRDLGGMWIAILVALGLAVMFDVGFFRVIRNRIRAKEYHQKSIDVLEGRSGEQTGELAASMERMSNKAYLDALRAHGVAVPEYFYERLTNSSASSFVIPKEIASIDSRSVQQETKDNEERSESISSSDEQREEQNAAVAAAFCRSLSEKVEKDKSAVQQETKVVEETSEIVSLSDDQREGQNADVAVAFCRKCGAKIPADSAFCPKCGVKVISFYCRKCGAEISVDSDFCIRCGAPISPRNRTKDKEENSPVKIKQTTTEPALDDNKTGSPKRKFGPIIIASILAISLLIGGLYYFKQSKEIINNKEKLEQISASCIQIKCYGISGSLESNGGGFIAFSDDTIVTNYHVIEDHPYSIKAVAENGKSYSVDQILAYDPDADIAILHLQKHSDLLPLTFSKEPVAKTDKVIAIWSPLGLANVISEGNVSGIKQIEDLSAIQYTASSSLGSSGGVLLNKYGEVVGVPFAASSDGQFVNMAIPIDYVEALFAYKGSSISIRDYFSEKVYSISGLFFDSKYLDEKKVTVQGYISSVIPDDESGLLAIILVSERRDVIGFDGRKVTMENYENDPFEIEKEKLCDRSAIVVLANSTLSNIQTKPGSYVEYSGVLYEYEDEVEDIRILGVVLNQ